MLHFYFLKKAFAYIEIENSDSQSLSESYFNFIAVMGFEPTSRLTPGF